MKHMIIAFILSMNIVQAQSNDFIEIETNKVLCIFSFLETATKQRSVSISYHQLIHDTYGKDTLFQNLYQGYQNLKLHYHFEKQEYPENRYSFGSTKDLLWIASSHSVSIDDFNQRIVGMLPHSTQVALINCMKDAESYYDRLIWDKEQDNISMMEVSLEPYKEQIAELYNRISHFYGANWDQSVPFRVLLYPIPLDRGNTTAIPKGNALICGFLTHRHDDHVGRLGVIVHEMCHILYDAQSLKLQHQVEDWFLNSDSPYNKLAYSYIDEGLATVLGNGWAYKQIHGSLDTMDWYNDRYINQYAKALYPLTQEYMLAEKSLDKAYVDRAIDIFGETFPDAIYNTKLLLNEIHLFANSEIEKDLDFISNTIREHFNIRSMWFSTPITNEQSASKLGEEQITKVLVVESNHRKTINFLREQYPELAIEFMDDTVQIFMDEKSKSPIILIQVSQLSYLNNAFAIIQAMNTLKFDTLHQIIEVQD